MTVLNLVDDHKLLGIGIKNFCPILTVDFILIFFVKEIKFT